MKRMTRQKDEYKCRIANGCPIEDWSMDQTGYALTCDNCPIMKYINKLAEYEDLEEEVTKQIDKEITDILKKIF